MPYAVMQKTLDAVPVETLKNAFRGVPGLTPMDAVIHSRDAFGILVKGFQLDAANAIHNGLVSQGIETEVVDETSLPQLPEVQFLSRIECTTDALVLVDQIGRTADLAWKDIALVAAGHVLMTEFIEHKTKSSPIDIDATGPLDGLIFGTGGGMFPHSTSRYQTVPPIDSFTREERHERCLLEIIPIGAAVRYAINADKAMIMLFKYLGARRTDDLSANFRLVVQDVVRGAPGAAINRGAYYLRENSTPFVYPTKQSFYSEIVWTLWVMNQQAGA